MTDPVIKTGLLAALEHQLNELLALDPVTVKKLSRWFGKVVVCQCTSPPWHCFLHIEQGRIRLTGSHDGAVDAMFVGSGAALALLLIRRQLPFNQVPGLVVTGDDELLDDLQIMHRQLDIDWERPLGQTFGEMPGHVIAQSLRWVGDSVRRGQDMVMDNLGEYLQEELHLIPSRVDMEIFAEEVQQLAQHMEQLETTYHLVETKYHSNNKTAGKSGS